MYRRRDTEGRLTRLSRIMSGGAEDGRLPTLPMRRVERLSVPGASPA